MVNIENHVDGPSNRVGKAGVLKYKASRVTLGPIVATGPSRVHLFGETAKAAAGFFRVWKRTCGFFEKEVLRLGEGIIVV